LVPGVSYCVLHKHPVPAVALLVCMKMQWTYGQTGHTIWMCAYERGMPRRSSP